MDKQLLEKALSMRNRQAFTLVEISIVLVIVGLVVGGIMTGQAMLRAQRVRTVMVDAKQYQNAITQFADKYGALPGDMADAERVWGNAAGGDINTNCTSYATVGSSDGVVTCNGNGNGQIDANGEHFWAWQQLKAANYIAGRYTGAQGAGGVNNSLPGINVPKGPIDNSAFFFWNWGAQANNTTFYEGNYNDVIIFGAQDPGAWPSVAALTPQEAFELDKKADDGFPGTGVVRTLVSTWNGGNCTTSDSPSTATYTTTNSKNGCILLFLKAMREKKE